MKRLLSYLKRKRQPVVIFCLFALCVFISFSVRTYHYNNSVYALNFLIHDIPESELAPKPGFWKNFLPGYHRNFSPFTIESAMMYSYAQDIAEGKEVPKSDPGLCGMEDIPPYAQMNMGLEWFLGWGWRMKNFFFPDPAPDGKQILFQDHPYMAQWMSGQLRLWASLTSGFVFLWLITLGCGKCFALFGGLLHAVSLAAVARSTGQDIVRGEFCIPLITASVVLAYCIFRKPKIWKYILLFCTSFLAFVSWDLCQMLFGTWMCMELVRFFFGGKMSVSRGCVWLTISLAILMNALFVPFNITYGLIRSSVVWIMIPAVAVVYLYSYLERKYHYFESKKAIWKISVKIFLAVFVPLALYFLWNTVANTPEYASNYSHFGEAMKAKLAFWNVKPANPQMLSYDARIMWTPSMHSATWDILITFFPSLFFGLKMNFCLFRFIFGYLPVTLTVFLSFLLGVVLFRIPRVQFCKRWQSHLVPLLYAIGFLWGFVYIVRYHEFLILFMSVSLSQLLQSAWRQYRCQPSLIRQEYAYTKLYGMKWFSVIMRTLIAVLMIFCLSWETYASLFQAQRKYTGDVAMQDTARLIVWFRQAKRYAEKNKNTDPLKNAGVAANITIGPMLRAYAGTGVVMNPQFGLKRIRDATEQFLTAMYHGTEKELMQYCREHRAKYVIYQKGSLFDMGIYSNRYIANAQRIESLSPVNLMYHYPNDMQWFYPLTPPKGLAQISKTYAVFQVITPEDRQTSEDLTLKALEEYGKYNFSRAKELIIKAVELDPKSQVAEKVFFQIFRHPQNINIGGLILPAQENPAQRNIPAHIL